MRRFSCRRWSSSLASPGWQRARRQSSALARADWKVAFLVSFQLPLALTERVCCRRRIRRRVATARVSGLSGAVGAMLCRGRMPTAAAFRDWRLWLWLGPVSFLDTLPVSFAARLTDPLSVLAMAQRSPLFFVEARQRQLGRSITEGCRGSVLSK